MTRLKIITSYTDLARFYAGLEDTDTEVTSSVFPRQPYAFSQFIAVYLWAGVRVVIVETSHRRYEVFGVPAEVAAVPVEG